MSKSIKTTIGGAISAIGAAVIAYGEFVGMDLTGVGAAIVTVGLAILGIYARDDDVTSEGGKAPK